MRKARHRLQDMVYAIRRIEQYLQGLTESEFSTAHDSYWGIVKLVEVTGECAKNLPKEIVDANPQIPWNEMARTRDRFSHGYFDLSARLVLEISRKLQERVLPEIIRILESDDQIDD
jgi:uncharacterized protein with HEPN domain